MGEISVRYMERVSEEIYIDSLEVDVGDIATVVEPSGKPAVTESTNGGMFLVYWVLLATYCIHMGVTPLKRCMVHDFVIG